MKNLEVGKTYKTKGGWDVLVIFQRHKKLSDKFGCRLLTADPIFFAIHKPGTEEESTPIFHDANGITNIAVYDYNNEFGGSGSNFPLSCGENPANIFVDREVVSETVQQENEKVIFTYTIGNSFEDSLLTLQEKGTENKITVVAKDFLPEQIKEMLLKNCFYIIEPNEYLRLIKDRFNSIEEFHNGYKNLIKDCWIKEGV